MAINYSFKEATIDDLPLILQWTELLMEHEAMADDIELPLTDNISELLNEWLKNLISDNNSLLIIASDILNDKPVGIVIGFLQLQPNNFTDFKMHGVIQMVWVDKKNRNKGLALQLVTHMEDTFKNLDIHYCEIQYSESNSQAEGFWKKAGYQVVSHNSRKIFS